jgi:hypothetical protein
MADTSLAQGVSADRGEKRRGDDHVHARDGHQPLDLRRAERVAGHLLLDLGDLLVEELDLAQTAVDGLALPGRQLDLAQPFTPGQPERVADRRLLDQPADQHGVALVLRARARPDQLTAACQPPPQRPRLLGIHNPSSDAGGEQPGERAGVEPVGLRARRLP